MKEKRKTRRNGLAAIAMLVALMMVAQLFTPAVALAAVSDGDTKNNYRNVFQKGSSTRDSGRVWSDKSVYNEATNIDGKNFDLETGENFNVVYSLIGSSEKITGKSNVPLDVMFILDVSGSMGGKDNKDRIIEATKALNSSMINLLQNNPENRVGITTFSDGAQVILPLGRYEQKTEGRRPKKVPFISSDGENITIKHKDLSSRSWDVTGGTNTQAGFDAGMKALANEQTTTATVDGKTVKRAPVVVMLSDGEPTYSCYHSSWWSPANYKTQGPGTKPHYGNGMLAMMNATYQKKMISQNYGVSGTPLETKIYTIGLAVADQELANITLNPKEKWNDTSNFMAKKIVSKWTEYKKGKTPSVEVRKSEDESKFGDKTNTEYTLNHPGQNDIKDLPDLKYNDAYYSVENSSELDKVFDNIVSDISTAVPDYPTELKDTSAATSGYVTYTDPIGEYMEVKNVKSIIYNGTSYELTGNLENGFKGSGTIKDPVTGKDVSLEGLTVTINKDAQTGRQTLVAKVPAAAIPLKINEVKLKKDGSVESNNTLANPSPIRIVYSVGLKNGVENLSGVSTEYINNNTENGKVNFYSNLFTGKTDNTGKTIGDAKTEFTPAKDNPNYYFQQDVTIYHDIDLKKPVKSTETFDPNATYYIGTPFYNGTTVEQAIVIRNGAAYVDAENNGYLEEVNGNWALKAGTPRNYQIEQDFAVEKTVNSTNTAEMLYSPSVQKAGFEISTIQFRHGNNGKVQVEAPGNLIIKKTVTTAEGVTAPDKTYKFDVSIPYKAGQNVTTEKTDANGKVTNVTVIFDGTGEATIELKDKESLKILNCLGDYTVDEQDPGEGFTVTAPDNATGNIKIAEYVNVEFKNEYKVTPLEINQTEFGFPMSKTMTGRSFKETDNFKFTITGPEGAMPERTEAEIDGAKLNGQSVAEIDFGKFTFTKSGTFDYIVTETTGTTPGITYDAKRYKLTVVVADDGHGNLSISSSKVSRDIGEGNWADVTDKKMSFTNNYNAKSASVNLSGHKTLENKGLDELARAFEFRIKALTEGAPMPANISEVGTVSASTVDGSIAFNDIEFTTKDIDEAYEYVITEIQPTKDGEYGSEPLEGAVKDKDGNWVYKGITFDHSENKVTILVTSSDESGIATIVANSEGNNFEFKNTYNAEGEYNFTNTEGGEPGIKNITGRKFNSNDTFTFDVNSEVSEGAISKEATLPKEITIKPTDGNTFNFDFGSLKFTEADAGKTFTYTFKEREGNIGGVTYDPAVKVVKLQVNDNNDGTLSIVRTGETLEWTNTYKATWNGIDGLTIVGEKNLVGKDLPRGAFTFTVQGLDGAPLTGGTELNNNTVKVTNGLGNTIYVNELKMFYILDNQKYTMEDLGGLTEKKFVYEIKEVKTVPTPAGMNYDDSVYHIEVIVTDDQKGNIYTDNSNAKYSKLNTATGIFETAQKVEFNNVYHPEEITVVPFVEGNSLLKKQLVGPRKDNLKADEFKFDFKLKSATPENGVVVDNEGLVGNQAPDNGTPNIADVVFENSKITFKEVGTYVFTITEDTRNLPDGVTSNVSEIEITYTVVDNDGKLVATPKFTGEVKDGVFVNEYNISGKVDGKTTLEVEKILTGRDENNSWTENDSFEFNLAANDEATSEAVELGHVKLLNDHVIINNTTTNHKAAFGDIEITYPGTYTFKVSENTAGLEPGVHGDSVNRILTVKAVDLGNGNLDVTSSIKAETTSATVDGEKDNLVFTNIYKPGEATLSGQAYLNVTKKLTGRDWLPSDEFIFTLEAGDEVTKAAVGTNVIFGTDEAATSITITNKSVDQTEHFGDIVFKDKGRYTFNVTESKPNVPNVSYETEPKQVVVDVALNDDGTLSAELNKTSDMLTFTNAYTPTYGTLDGAANLAVTKEITGRDWLEGETFQFELKAANEAAEDQNKVVLPEETVITVNADTKTNHFGDITFKEKGIYEFDIVEKIPEGVENGADGLTYDKVEKHVVVNVEDNNDGTLTITKDEKNSDALEFTNTYVPTPLTYDGATNLKVQKVIDGRKWQTGDKFTFTLAYDYKDQATDDAYKAGYFILPESKLVDIEYKEGQAENEYVANFGDIIFKKAGTYKFTIAEVKGDISGITYDTATKEFTVTVTDDGKGKLTATENSLITFINKYEVKQVVLPAQSNLQVTKVFTGRPGDKWKEEDQFTFTLEPKETYEQGSFTLGETECTIKAEDVNKVATFGDITFYKPGKYEFIVNENVPDGLANDHKKDGIVYDVSIKKVAVEVTDDGKGQLHASVDKGNIDSLVFTNKYEPSDLVIDPTQKPKGEGTVGIKLNKILKGREWKVGDSFSFKIEALDGAPLPSNPECTVTEQNQKFDFGVLTINHEDMKGEAEKIFRYKVTEIIPEEKIPGVTYTTEPIIFTVKASDDGNGFLIAGNGTPNSGLVRNEADDLNAGEFTNVYTPEEVDLDGAKNLKVVKNFTGRAEDKWNDTDEFTFQLTISDPETSKAKQDGYIILPENAKGIKITANDDPKEKAFGNIKFKKVGTYKFDITEINQNIAGVTYAPAQTVTVEVTDDNNGKLVANVKEGTGLKPFNNTYKTGSDTLSGKDHLNVVKEINGRDWIEGDSFTFTIESNDELTTNAIEAGNIVMPEESEVTITIDDKTADHTKNFGNITFNAANADGEHYEFKVTEKLPEGVTAGADGTANVDGVIYNTTPQIVNVTVKDMGDGTLKAETETKKMTFVNKYENGTVTLNGEANLNITKKLNGIHQWTDKEQFEFYITANNELAQKVELPQNIEIKYDEASSGYGEHQNHFSDITFKEPGVYEFYIHEKVPADKIPGVAYDTTPRKVVVTVTDDNKGHLSVNSEPKEFTFENTFNPAPVTLSGLTYLNVEKTLHGRGWNPEDSFTFTLTPDADTADMNTDTKTAFELPTNASGLVLSYDPALDSGEWNGRVQPHRGHFGNIKFYEEGYYTFVIKETPGNIPNIEYAKNEYRINISVFANRDTGKLEADIRDVRDGKDFPVTDEYDNANHTVKFTNSYSPDNTELKGTDIIVKKELLGREWKPGDKFEFKLELAESYFNSPILPDPNVIEIAYNEEGNYTAHFGNVIFKEPSTYKLKISEVVPEDPIPGMNYAGYQIVEVKVTDDYHGQLHAEVVGSKIHEFTNAYKAEPGILEGKTNLQVQKVFEGRDEWKADDSFTFKLAGKTKATNDAIKKGIVTLGNTEVTINAADQIKNFGDIKFTEAGSYVFEVSEVIPENAPAYIKYDNEKKTIFVEVSDDNNGNLVAELSDTETKSVFTNKYAPDSATLDGKTNLEVTKELEGRAWKEGDTFLFAMEAADDTTATAIADKKVLVPSNFDEISIKYTDEDNKAAFGDITFKEEGTYTFKVYEKAGTSPSVTYDGVERFVTVTVKDDNTGKLSIVDVTVKASGEENADKDNLIFTNTYEAGPAVLNGETNLKVNKAIHGRDWKDGDAFKFTIAPSEDYGTKAEMSEPKEITIAYNAEKNYVDHFGDINFNEAGTYEFTITEAEVTIPGMGTAKPHKVTVKVTDNGGKLVAEVTGDKTSDFVNEYAPEEVTLNGEANLQVAKVFEGRDPWQETDSFTFELSPYNDGTKEAVENGIVVLGNDTATINKADETAAFGDIQFKQRGSYAFVVKEVIPENAPSYIEYDKSEKVIHIDVNDKNGKLEAKLLNTEAKSVFTNKYAPDSATLDGKTNLEVTKDLKGRDWKDGDTFQFVMEAADEETKAAIKEGTVIVPENPNEISIDHTDEDKKAAFGDITFKEEGTYTFKVYEKAGTIPSVTYDGVERFVTVTVKDNNTGKLGIENVTVKASGEDNTDKDNLTFTNTYKAEQAVLNGETNLKVNKTISGRDWKEGDAFTFTLTPANDYGDKVVMTDPTEITIAYNDEKNYVSHFGDIKFNEAGTYEFVITEADVTIPGMETAESKKVTVKVTDNGGKLVAEVTGDKTSKFVNKYAPEEVTLDGEANLQVEKVFEGRDPWQETDSFTFELSPHNDGTKEAVENGIVVLGNDTVTINKADETAAFGDIQFKQRGSYAFVVKEVIPENAPSYIEYDKSEKVIQIDVNDKNGKLEAKLSNTEAKSVFTNKYTPDPVVLDGKKNLEVTKDLKGRDWKDGDTFQFVMEAADEETKAAIKEGTVIVPENPNEISIGHTDEDKKAAFGDITFKEEGTYTFKVYEKAGTSPSVTYDGVERFVTVTVEDNNTGKLTIVDVTVKASGEGNTDKDNLTFTNTYEAGPAVLNGETNLKVKKTIHGRDWKEGDAFTFTIAPSEDYGTNVEMSEPKEITIAYNAEKNYVSNFGDIKFNEAGTYEFTITESAVEITGMETAKPHKVTVKVTDNGGKLAAEVTGEKTSEFVNKYNPEEGVLNGEANLQVEKVFEGRDPWQETDSFTFELSPHNDGTKEAVENGIVVLGNDTVTINKADETAAFGDIQFKQRGSYAFVVKEVIPENAPSYIEYDKSEKVIQIDVNDKNGKLEAKLSNTEAKSVFTNKYTPDPVVLEGKTNLEVTKELEGRDWKDGDTFLFAMEAADEATSKAVDNGKVVVPSNFEEISIEYTDKDKKAAFGDITFKEEGTYTFKVYEKAGTSPSVTYDGVERFVTVTVEDNNKGKLTIVDVTVKASGEGNTDKDNLTFTNTYKAEIAVLNGATNLKVKKTISGRDWKVGDEFKFTLTPANDYGDKVVMTDPTEITIAYNADNNYVGHFGDIQFNEKGTYEFVITESDVTIPGMETAEPQKVTVKVTDNGGNLAAEVTGEKTTEFVNKFTQQEGVLEGKTNLIVEKTIKGRLWKGGDTFEFKIAPDAATAALNTPEEKAFEMPANADRLVISYNQNSNYTANFGDIKFYKAGEYKFNISEIKGTINGITYDETVYTVTVNVANKNNNELEVTATGLPDNKATFENSYDSKSVVLNGETNLKVKKTIHGRDWKEGDAFTFTIAPSKDYGTDIEMADPTEITIAYNADENYVSHFGDIKFNEAGTYEFTITESAVTIPGMGTAKPHKVTVKVTDNDGKLVAEVTGEKTNEFVNKYNPEEGVLNGEANLQVEKVFEGRDPWQETDSFTFELLPYNEGTKEAVKDGTIILGNDTVTISNADEIAAFGDIKFTQKGSYAFVVKEVIPENAPSYIDYDKSEKVIHIDVNDRSGRLEAKLSGTDVKSVFTNKYVPEPAVLDGEANLEVTKVLKGRQWQDSDTFHFVMEAANEETKAAIKEGTVIVPENLKDISIDKTDKDNKASFGDITFKKVGTYTFKVYEKAGTIPSVKYDNSERIVTIVVTDNKDGKLVATVADTSDKLEFVNTYSAKAGELDGSKNLKVSKKLVGRPDNKWTDDDVYTFTLALDKDDKATMDAADTITLPGNAENLTLTKDKKTGSFGDILFTEEGTFKFVITEVNTKVEGVKYDTTVYKFTVVVTEDNEKGELVATTDHEGIFEFTNTYDPETVVVGPSGDKKIEIKKVLTGRALTKDDKWTFTIRRADDTVEGTPLPEVTKVNNNKGEITFGDITYTEPGVYKYVITESGNVAGVTNDENPQINVTVTVTKDESTGKLTATVTYDKNTFTNNYSVTSDVLPGDTELIVKKELKGREWKLGDKFYFNIEAADQFTKDAVANGEVILPGDLEINSEDKDSGKYKVGNFGDITFKKAGTFKFNITENQEPYITGVTNDTSVKKLVVNVVDEKNDGKLTVTKDPSSDELVFVNKYKASEVTIPVEDAFEFNKVFVGREWESTDKFTFVITGENGAPMPEKTKVTVSGGNKSFNFGSIHFKAEDLGTEKSKSFTYIVKEVVPEDTKGIAYDTVERKVTITITDDGTGQLKTNVAVEGDKTFTNVFGTSEKYGDTVGKVKITKVLENHELTEGQFKFEIIAQDEKSKEKLNSVGGTNGKMVVSNGRATVGKDGKARWSTNPFDSMTFVKDKDKDEQGTYTFLIREIKENKDGYTYDETEYLVTINVKYNEKTGQLEITTTNGNVVFNNKYEASGVLGGEGSVKIFASKTLKGREMKPGEFEFEVINRNPNVPAKDRVVATGKNTGTEPGSPIEFTPIEYSLDTIESSGYESKEVVNGNTVYTYSYQVVEKEVADGITRETPVFNITVKVTDDGKGNLVPVVIYPEKTGSLDFINTYNAENVSINITATKKLQTPEGALISIEDIAGKYEFVLKAVDAEYIPIKDETTVVPEVKAIEEPVVEEPVVEESVAEEPVKEESETLQTENPEEEIGEELVAEELLKDLDVQETETEPEPEPEEVVVETAKQQAKPIENPLPAKVTATNDAAGNVKFGPIVYDLSIFDGVQPAEDGSRTVVFTYEITERNTVDGITNDPEPKTVRVTVTDNGKGQITATVNAEDLENLVFVNVYTFTPGTSSLTGSGQFDILKKLEGRTIRDAEFKFELKDENGNVVATGKNDENGIVHMTEVEFTEPGTYQFTLYEVNGGKKLENGVKYDEKAYEVTAEVTDLKNGQLGVKWTVKGADKEILFINNYDPKATAVTLGANKILSGRKIKAGEFTFILKDESGNVLQTVKNDKNGMIRFDKIVYNEAGTWKYTVEEIAGSEKYMRYDNTVYNLTVNVVDDGNGFLRPELINENGQIVFHNIYEKPEEPSKPSKPENNKPGRPTPSGGGSSTNTNHKQPKTGDTNDVTLWAVLMVLAAGTAVVTGKKRKNK